MLARPHIVHGDARHQSPTFKVEANAAVDASRLYISSDGLPRSGTPCKARSKPAAYAHRESRRGHKRLTSCKVPTHCGVRLHDATPLSRRPNLYLKKARGASGPRSAAVKKVQKHNVHTGTTSPATAGCHKPSKIQAERRKNATRHLNSCLVL